MNDELELFENTQLQELSKTEKDDKENQDCQIQKNLIIFKSKSAINFHILCFLMLTLQFINYTMI